MWVLLFESPEQLPQFKGDGDFAFFLSLALDRDQKVLKVAICPAKGQQFPDAAACVEQSRDQSVKPHLVEASWFPCDELPDFNG
jgi:hypothetical protein